MNEGQLIVNIELIYEECQQGHNKWLSVSVRSHFSHRRVRGQNLRTRGTYPLQYNYLPTNGSHAWASTPIYFCHAQNEELFNAILFHISS